MLIYFFVCVIVLFSTIFQLYKKFTNSQRKETFF